MPDAIDACVMPVASEVSYLRTGPVLRASCFSRRTCVRDPLDDRFFFLVLLLLTVMGDAPFIKILSLFLPG